MYLRLHSREVDASRAMATTTTHGDFDQDLGNPVSSPSRVRDAAAAEPSDAGAAESSRTRESEPDADGPKSAALLWDVWHDLQCMALERNRALSQAADLEGRYAEALVEIVRAKAKMAQLEKALADREALAQSREAVLTRLLDEKGRFLDAIKAKLERM